MREQDIEAARAAILNRREELIRQFGYMVQAVFGSNEPSTSPFAYTIGLTDKNRPELLTIGLPPEVGQPLLNHVAKQLLARDEYAPVDRERLELVEWPMPFYLVRADKERAEQFARGASLRSNGRATYLQVVWPDPNGKFPWEPGADFSSCPQVQLLAPPPPIH